MSESTTVFVQLVPITCSKCGCLFGLTAEMRAALQRSGETFHCPNGHARVYRETDADRLQKQLAAERAAHDQTRSSLEFAREQRDRQERRAIALRGVVTRTKNRVGNGVCPCCSRSFQNLRRHMATKHPAWKAADAEASS